MTGLSTSETTPRADAATPHDTATPQTNKSPKKTPGKKKLSPMCGTRAPRDLADRTPLGAMATSPVPKVRDNRPALESALYAPGDRSIVGDRTPPRSRSGPGFGSPSLSAGGSTFSSPLLQRAAAARDGSFGS